MSPDARPANDAPRETDLACLPQLARVVAAASIGAPRPGGPAHGRPGPGIAAPGGPSTGDTAQGGRSVADCLDEAIGSGVPLTALREALLLVAPFAGFPRALDALDAFAGACGRAGVVAPAAPESGTAGDFRARGRAFFDRVYGAGAARVLDRIRRLDPDVPEWVLESAYGRVLSRPGLTAAARECLAVVLLTALRLPNQLRGHVHGALACGATPDDVRTALAAAGDLLQDDLVQMALTSLPGGSE